jgi:AcrR family transcriptional regulator
MARPVVIEDGLILMTAREVFLEKGPRATTTDIAARAGISQGILFKRFKTKQALFRASMNLQGDEESPLPLDLYTKIGVDSVQENLRELGNALVNKFFGLVPTMMMDWSIRREEATAKEEVVAKDELAANNELASSTDSEGSRSSERAPDRAVRRIHMISSYLKEEEKLGRIRSANTEIIAQTFVGALWHYAFLQVMMGEVHKQPLTQEQYVNGVVGTLWCGIAPCEQVINLCA